MARATYRSLAACLLCVAGCSPVLISDKSFRAEMPTDPTVVYCMAQQQLDLTVKTASDDKGAATDTITLSTLPISADTSDCYALAIPHGWMSSDAIKVSTTNDGVLTAINATREDETLQVIQKSIEIAEQVAKVIAAKKGAAAAKPTTQTHEWVFDPVSKTSFAANGYTATFTPDSAPAVNCVSGAPPIEGIFYHPVVPGTFTLKAGDDIVLASRVKVPLKQKCLLPLTAQHFVKTQFIVAFELGAPTSIEAVRPSEALALVTFLPDALKGLVSIPIDLRAAAPASTQSRSAPLAVSPAASTTSKSASN